MSAAVAWAGRQIKPDPAILSMFFDGMFKHADRDTSVVLKAFEHDTNKPVFPADPTLLSTAARDSYILNRAAQTARNAQASVFCPPTGCTFRPNPKKPGSATEDDIANGLSISVDVDTASPSDAVAKLTAHLGEPTFVVESGGIWIDPATGEIENKIHVHYRLAKESVTRNPADHRRLQEARWLASILVGGDTSLAPLVHPLRWPGSVHNKDRQNVRLATIVASSDNELSLDEALAVLRAATPGVTYKAAPVQEPGSMGGVGELTGDMADIASALAEIPNADLTWEEWNRVGMATWAASEGQAFEAFDAWSRKSSKYGLKESPATRWANYFSSPPTRIGSGTIYHMANAANPSWTKPSHLRASEEFENFNPGSSTYQGVASEGDLPPHDPIGQHAEPRAKPHSKLLTWFGETPPVAPRWLVDGILPETGVALLAGQSGAGKTYVALDIAMAVATGQYFAGARVRREGAVLFLAAEGESEIDARLLAIVHGKINGPQIVFDIQKWIAENGNTPPALDDVLPKFEPLSRYPFSRQIVDMPLLTEKDARQKLMPIVRAAECGATERFGLPLALIIVDTLSAAAGFEDENSASQTQKVMNLLADLSRSTGALVLVVDHFGKTAETGVRGSSAKTGAADAILAVKADIGDRGVVKNRQMVVTKLRGGKTGLTKPFELRTADIDAWGESNCFLEWLDRKSEAEAEANEAEIIAEADTATALLRAIANSPGGTLVKWAEAIGKSKAMVSKTLIMLEKEKLAGKVLGQWGVTPKGRKHLEN